MLIDNSQGESVQQIARYAALLNDAGLIALVLAGAANDDDQAFAQQVIGQALLPIDVAASSSLEEAASEAVKALIQGQEVKKNLEWLI
jgi:bifunctional enzyme CysN/CysC